MASVPHERRFDWFDVVTERFPLKGTVVSIAWRILKHLNAEKGEAWPSETAIAEKLRIDERTVRRGVGDLAKAGLITITYGCGRSQTNRYRLALPDDVVTVGATAVADQASEEKGDSPVQKGGQPCPEKGDRAVRGTLIKNPTRTLPALAPEIRDAEAALEPSSTPRSPALPMQPGRSVAGLLRKEADRSAFPPGSYPDRHSDEGKIEVRLAARIGRGDSDAGYAVLIGMPEAVVEKLRNAERFGRVTDAMLAEVRLQAARPSTPHGDGVRFRRSEPRAGPQSAEGDSSATFTDHEREPRHAEQ